MATTWIVSGDSSRARVLQVTGRERLAEVRDFANPKGRMDDRELTAGAEHEAAVFAKAVDRFLDQERMKHSYDRLVMLAPPKFLGLLRKNLGKEVEKLVADGDPPTLAWFDAREIERFLRPGKD